MTALDARTRALDVAGTEARLRAVPRPRPVLDRERERGLTERQRQLLDELDVLFAGGFAHLTMAQLASRLNCSLRTLYALAPSRDELVLVVVDRGLWRVGRSAQEAIDPTGPPLAALRTYLEAATVAVSHLTEAFARDLAAVRAAQELSEAHSEYLFRVVRTLLDAAVDQGDVDRRVDTAAVARVLAGLGRAFTRPEVIPTLRSTPKEAADEVVDIVLRGLPTPTREERR